MADHEAVLGFWFGLDPQRWWTKDAAFDRDVRERFAGEHAAVLRGERDGWLATPRGRLAYVIVLDQLSRNMFRDTPRAFAADDRALDAAAGGIARGHDRDLPPGERGFLYMPYMHSELLPVQERCCELFASLGDAEQLDYARRHRDIVARFGRFPHRNAILGRPSTPEELAFLTQPGSSF